MIQISKNNIYKNNLDIIITHYRHNQSSPTCKIRLKMNDLIFF